MSSRRSTYSVLGIPEGLGIPLVLLSLALAIAPYAPGLDFGIFKVPILPNRVQTVLQWLGPLAVVAFLFLFLPVWRTRGSPVADPSTQQRPQEDSPSQEPEQLPDHSAEGTTYVQDNIAHFRLTELGKFVGGAEALRRISISLLDENWHGDVEVHHAYYEKILSQMDSLHKRPQLTEEVAKTLGDLRIQSKVIAQNIEVVRHAIRLTFACDSPRMSKWGVPMMEEWAVDFLKGIFAECTLAPGRPGTSVRCQLFVPRRIDDPVSIDISLSDDEARSIQSSWREELAEYDSNRPSIWGWPTLIPLWHLSDAFISTRLLPAIAVKLVASIVSHSPATADDAWTQLTYLFPTAERDVLQPYDWTLAINSVRSAKDLAWLHAPPKERSKLDKEL